VGIKRQQNGPRPWLARIRTEWAGWLPGAAYNTPTRAPPLRVVVIALATGGTSHRDLDTVSWPLLYVPAAYVTKILLVRFFLRNSKRSALHLVLTQCRRMFEMVAERCTVVHRIDADAGLGLNFNPWSHACDEHSFWCARQACSRIRPSTDNQRHQHTVDSKCGGAAWWWDQLWALSGCDGRRVQCVCAA
jgi:hypothetical protein